MSRPGLRERVRTIPALTAALLAAGILAPAAQAQVQTAGALLVNVDATAATEGALNTIPNTGTLGGAFQALGGDAAIPLVTTVGGTKGIMFDGGDFLQLTSEPGVPTVVPEGLVGLSPTATIEVWALNPQIAGEESLVSWGNRGGPDGSNMSFNYGSDFRWGAVGHWGNTDLGWANTGGAPAADKWHHLVYTMDGTVQRVYADGQPANAEYIGDRVDIDPLGSILIGAQMEPDGTTVTGGLRFTGTIAKVRVHDGALTAEQVLANYNAEKAQFVDPQPPAGPVAENLTRDPIHRYSFSEPAAANADGLQFADSIGDADGQVLGAGGTFTGTRLTLPGGSSDTQAYGDLPNGLLSKNSTNNAGTGQFTFETWVKVTGSRTWSRIFDFGSSGFGGVGEEVLGPDGSGDGLDYLMLSAQVDANTGTRRLELRNEEPGGGGIVTIDASTTSFNSDSHVVITWDEATGVINHYENGNRVATMTTDDAMSEINDVNVWLGRSNWQADQNMQGEFDEVRIYDYVLTQGQAYGNTVRGANSLTNVANPVTITSQPQNVTTSESYSATFNVGVEGTPPFTYQWLRNGTEIAGATNASYTASNLAASDAGTRFSVRVSNKVGNQTITVTSSEASVAVQPESATLRHRYSFNEASGVEARDSVGAAHGTLMGTATFVEGGQVQLDGVNDTYIDLPNGIITALGANGSFEMWVTEEFGGVWTRVFDFGNSDAGEDFAGTGVDYLFYSPRTDGGPRFTADFPEGGNVAHVYRPNSTTPFVQEHIVITWNAAANESRLYTNGVLVATGPAPQPLSNMAGQDVNNWLGRSQFINDAGFTGKYNEFRIYSGAMSPDQVSASFAAGPNALPSPAPRLNVQLNGNSLVVSWPSSATGFTLEATPSLTNPTWTSLGTGTSANGQQTVTVPIEGNARFLRLRQ